MENEEKTVVCPECGSKDIGKKYNGEYFCRNCGYDVISCRQCGSFDIKKGAGGILFCRDCGTKITSAVPANETIIGDISTAKETTAEKASGTKKSQIISIFIVAAITLAVVILTLVFAKFDCSLINEWTYDDDDNKVIYRFNKDGTFTEKEGSLTVNGTYTVDNNKINLNYNYIDLDLKNEFTYSISGDIMTLSIDVGTGFISSDYRCTSINRNFLIKLIIVIIEIAIATIICIIFVKKKKKKKNENDDDDDEKYVDMCVDDYYQQKTSKHIKIVTLIVSIIALLTTFAFLQHI